MRRFCGEGCLVLRPGSLSAAFHASVFDQLERVHAEGGPLGNTVLDAIPDIAEVYADPVIRGGIAWSGAAP